MLKLDRDDFGTLETFPLRWRWTDPNYKLLPPEDLALIRPLSQAGAEKADRLVHQQFDRLLLPLYAPNDKADASCNAKCERATPGSMEPTKVREWLSHTLPTEPSDVLVNWDRDTCVLADRRIFIKYWADFCYPASDDVTVLPLAFDWLLHYAHWEEMYFWGRESPHTSQSASPGVEANGTTSG